MNRNVWGFIGLLLVIGILLFWRPFAESEQAPEENQFREVKPDFRAEGLLMRVYNAEGELVHRISAEKMTHYSPIGLTELSQPTYIVHTKAGDATWQVMAEQGSFYSDKSLVLERDIEIRSLNSADFLDRVETSYLVIDTLTEQMETEQPVTIFGKQFTMRGEGMTANLQTQIVELIEHVETVYTFEPSSD